MPRSPSDSLDATAKVHNSRYPFHLFTKASANSAKWYDLVKCFAKRQSLSLLATNITETTAEENLIEGQVITQLTLIFACKNQRLAPRLKPDQQREIAVLTFWN